MSEKIPINWEKLAETIAASVAQTPEFEAFCDDQACKFEDNIREELRIRYSEDVGKSFNFGEADEHEMEFVMTLEGDLIHAFMKYFVTRYLGRKW